MDGLGSTVKRLINQEILTGKPCENSSDFFILARSKTSSIKVYEVLSGEIDAAKEELEDMFKDARHVPGIQKIHSKNVMDVDVIECRQHSKSGKKMVVHF